MSDKMTPEARYDEEGFSNDESSVPHPKPSTSDKTTLAEAIKEIYDWLGDSLVPKRVLQALAVLREMVEENEWNKQAAEDRLEIIADWEAWGKRAEARLACLEPLEKAIAIWASEDSIIRAALQYKKDKEGE